MVNQTKLKKNTVISNFEMGGLNMIDIESYFASLRASWVSRFVIGEMDNWKLIPYKYFRQFGKNWFSLNIFYLLKYAKRIRHKLNKLMKSSPTYNKLQHYLIEHACI